LRDWILNGEYVDRLFFKIKISKGAVCLSFSDLDAGAAATRFYSSISGVFVDGKYPKITYTRRVSIKVPLITRLSTPWKQLRGR